MWKNGLAPAGLHFVGKRLTRVDRGSTSFSFPRGVDLKIIFRALAMEDSGKRYACDILFACLKTQIIQNSDLAIFKPFRGSFLSKN